jgi:hypothetical protein
MATDIDALIAFLRSPQRATPAADEYVTLCVLCERIGYAAHAPRGRRRTGERVPPAARRQPGARLEDREVPLVAVDDRGNAAVRVDLQVLGFFWSPAMRFTMWTS